MKTDIVKKNRVIDHHGMKILTKSISKNFMLTGVLKQKYRFSGINLCTSTRSPSPQGEGDGG